MNHRGNRERVNMTSYQPRVDVNNNNSEEDWESIKPRMESSLQKLKNELAELRQSDKILLKKFIKMRSEIKEMSKDVYSL